MIWMEQKRQEKEAGENGEKEEREKKSIFRESGLKKWILMGTAGVLLLLLSVPEMFSGSEKEEEAPAGEEKTEEAQQQDWEESYVRELEKQLSEVLSSVEGVGNNRVMITLNASKEEIVEKDQPYTQENEKQSEQGAVVSDSQRLEMSEETVYYELEDGSRRPYVVKVMQPQIAGIVVVAQGGEVPQIQQEIIHAAEALFSVPSHKIVVMKMKSAENR